ncbi:exodeoxyribonuclease VII large subunit [Vogesella oryzae]|uniref:exodeoxyribonuclease VII large subunit n=1 Tax=Vogesella oryzae TaxID=1735285 RepID=UPI0015827674|nr:exodeoxyribonuclease VII large subunit [Vogesella oryzae]
MFFSANQNDVISVATLNRMARDLLESGLPPMWIGGEISNLTLAASGHGYFSLKDSNAQIRCVMFRNKLSQLDFRLSEGMQVELRGTVTLYEARGDYQINVDTLRAAGLGRLYEAFARLKAKLEAEGLFDNQRKQALPPSPQRVGIVTSPAAAALRDVVTTLRRRMPAIELILYPCQVQGSTAPAQIVAAINAANRRAEVDVLIVCRGGGSIEDLWAFNDEAVARAIAASQLPVVSGIGHETDFTIADFVADRRAPTPTAAAEMVSPSREALQQGLDLTRRQLERALSRLLTDKTQQLDYLGRRLQHPGDKLQQQQQKLGQYQLQLRQRLQEILRQRQWRLDSLRYRLAQGKPALPRLQQALQQRQQQLQATIHRQLAQQQLALGKLEATLLAMNPEAVLARGYAIVQNEAGKVIHSPAELHEGEAIRLQLADGSARARVELEHGTQSQLPF